MVERGLPLIMMEALQGSWQLLCVALGKMRAAQRCACAPDRRALTGQAPKPACTGALGLFDVVCCVVGAALLCDASSVLRGCGPCSVCSGCSRPSCMPGNCRNNCLRKVCGPCGDFLIRVSSTPVLYLASAIPCDCEHTLQPAQLIQLAGGCGKGTSRACVVVRALGVVAAMLDDRHVVVHLGWKGLME